jgi:hypothetical protein
MTFDLYHFAILNYFEIWFGNLGFIYFLLGVVDLYHFAILNYFEIWFGNLGFIYFLLGVVLLSTTVPMGVGQVRLNRAKFSGASNFQLCISLVLLIFNPNVVSCQLVVH